MLRYELNIQSLFDDRENMKPMANAYSLFQCLNTPAQANIIDLLLSINYDGENELQIKPAKDLKL